MMISKLNRRQLRENMVVKPSQPVKEIVLESKEIKVVPEVIKDFLEEHKKNQDFLLKFSKKRIKENLNIDDITINEDIELFDKADSKEDDFIENDKHLNKPTDLKDTTISYEEIKLNVEKLKREINDKLLTFDKKISILNLNSSNSGGHKLLDKDSSGNPYVSNNTVWSSEMIAEILGLNNNGALAWNADKNTPFIVSHNINSKIPDVLIYDDNGIVINNTIQWSIDNTELKIFPEIPSSGTYVLT